MKRRLRKISLVFVVCLTAAMTLIAATPRDICVCRIVASVAAGASCRCGAGGPQALPTREVGKVPHSRKPRKACCCCNAKREHSHEPVEPGCQAKQFPCIRAIAQAEFLVNSTSDTSAAKEGSDAPVLLAQSLAPSFLPGSSERGRAVWLVHLTSPPTDLVISLQHLII